MPEHRASGGCLCGGVAFRIAGRLRDIVVCHCRQCQRFSGSVVAATQCRSADLDIVRDDGLRWYASSPHAERGFCGACGSSLFWRRRGDSFTCVMAGALTPPTGLRTAAHIFTADQADWCVIGDGRPQFPRTMGSAVAAVRWS
ncbi:MAG: GFA family protein [Hyphomicrobiales bacterium]|nr:GFA family protein [Hyphomicrobiales bacterium]